MVRRSLLLVAAFLGTSCGTSGALAGIGDNERGRILDELIHRASGSKRDCECPRGEICDTETGECVSDSELPPPELGAGGPDRR